MMAGILQFRNPTLGRYGLKELEDDLLDEAEKTLDTIFRAVWQYKQTIQRTQRLSGQAGKGSVLVAFMISSTTSARSRFSGSRDEKLVGRDDRDGQASHVRAWLRHLRPVRTQRYGCHWRHPFRRRLAASKVHLRFPHILLS